MVHTHLQTHIAISELPAEKQNDHARSETSENSNSTSHMIAEESRLKIRDRLTEQMCNKQIVIGVKLETVFQIQPESPIKHNSAPLLRHSKQNP